MAFDVINIGTIPNDGTGDPLRTAFDKTNDNFALAVEGPAVATSGRVAVYDGTTGKLLQDGTKVEADLVVGPATATDGAVALFDGTTGKIIKQSTFLESSLTSLYPNTTTAGLWLSVSGGIGTVSHTEGSLFGLVLRVSNTINIDRIAANVATAGSAGAVIRLGIYRLNDNGSGFTLIVDAGTIDAATTGLKDIVISETLTPGAYFVGAASQGDALTAPVMRTKGSIDGVVQTNAVANHITTINGYRFFGVTGALPATLSYGDMLANTAVFVPLRIA
jgi:hypothetical protein